MTATMVAARATLALFFATLIVGGSVWCAIDTGVWWYGLLWGLSVVAVPAALIGLACAAVGE